MDPGRQNTKVSPAWPAKARDCSVATPTVCRLAWWNTTEKPSISRLNIGLTASGVTSRGAKPVPPVVITTSISGSSTQAWICLRMSSTSSFTMAWPAKVWPASVRRCTSKGPDLSVSSSRVSETVSTAIFSG